MQQGGDTAPRQRPLVPRRGSRRRAIARILVRAFDAGIRLLTRILGAGSAAGREGITEAELRDLVAANTVLDREERRLIAEVLAVGTLHVSELMVPRTEVAFLQAGMSVSEAITAVRRERHSRFPVTAGGPDDIVGFVHLRDLLDHQESGGSGGIGALAREMKRLPASKRVLAALSEMRRAGDQIAIVVDEYGGTAGIVTLEDLIEELVGEIHDEYDAAPEPAVAPGASPILVDGLLNLADFAERTGILLPQGPYETLGGFIMARLGRLPVVGDEVQILSWRLVVRELDGRRVARVLLAVAPSHTEKDATEKAEKKAAETEAADKDEGRDAAAR